MDTALTDPSEVRTEAYPTGVEWRQMTNGAVSVSVTNRGVWMRRRSEKNPKWVMVSMYAIMPVATIVDTTTREEWVRLRVQTVSMAINEVSIPAHQIQQFLAGRHEESNKGFPVPRNPALLAEAIMFLVRLGVEYNVVEQIRGTSVCGWTNGQFVRPGDHTYAGAALDMTTVRGDAGVWKQTLREFLKESPVAALINAYAVGGYMRGICNPSFSSILSIYGGSSQGKTLATLVAVSWQATPNISNNRPFAEAGSTSVGLEAILSWNRHGFFILDEAQRLGREQGGRNTRMDHVMHLTEGGSRRRGAGSEAVFWDNSIAITSNTPLADLVNAPGHDQEHALAARMLEIDCNRNPVWTWTDTGKVTALRSTLSENHGHGMSLAIADIMARKDELLELYHDTGKMTAAAIKRNETFTGLRCPLSRTGMGVISRQSEMIGLIECGLNIMGSVLETEFPEAAVFMESLWDESWLRYREEEEEPWQDQIVSFLIGNLSRSLILGCLHPAIDGYNKMDMDSDDSESVQQWAAEEHNQRVRRQRGEPWMVVEVKKPMKTDTDWSGATVWVLKPGADAADKSGRNLRQLAEQAHRDNGLKTSRSRTERGRKMLKAPKGHGRGYGFLLGD